jgi:hypothetical protein
VFHGITDPMFTLMMQLVQLVQQAIYTPIEASTPTTTLFVHAGTFAVRLIYNTIQSRLQKLERLQKLNKPILADLVKKTRPDLAGTVKSMLKMDLVKALESVPSLNLTSGDEDEPAPAPAPDGDPGTRLLHLHNYRAML